MRPLPTWLYVVAALAVAVVIPRLALLPHSVLDWDESVYALIGQQLLAGHLPYETVFDHKPIGLHLIFAGFFAVFGDSVASIRIIAIVFVAGTAAVLAWLARRQFNADARGAGLVAALYGFLSLASGGMATNTEILINLFVVSAIGIMIAGRLDQRISPPHALLAGVVLGMLFQVNYLGGVLVAGVAAFYLAWIVGSLSTAALVRLYFINGLIIFFGFMLVNLLLILPLVIAGDFPDYIGLQRAYLSGYTSDAAPLRLVQRIYEGVGPIVPFVLLGIVFLVEGLYRRFLADERPPLTDNGRVIRAWVILWMFGALAASMSGRFFAHFFLFMLPASVMLAAAVLLHLREQPALRRGVMMWMFLLAGFVATDNIGMYMNGLRGYANWLGGRPADPVAAVSEAMARELAPGDTIYVYDADIIHYFQTRASLPTRFVFPDHHLKEDAAARLGFGRPAHMQEVLATEPKFIVVNGDPAEETYGEASVMLAATLDAHYRRTALAYERGSRNVVVYERRPDTRPAP